MNNLTKYIFKELISFILFGIILLTPLWIITKLLEGIWGVVVTIIVLFILIYKIGIPLRNKIMKDVSYENLTAPQKKFILYSSLAIIILLIILMFTIEPAESLYTIILVMVGIVFVGIIYYRSFKKLKGETK